jgi:hypothetical protein
VKTDNKSSKDQALLISVAESIGSTLGAIAAKADAAQKAITGSNIVSDVKRETKKLVGKSKRAVAAKGSAKRSKPARAVRRAVRKTTKRVAGKSRRAKK